MKIKEANAGPLTNFEVLDFLRSRGASKDPNKIMTSIAPSESKVFDYLVDSAACNQTKEHINEFLEKCNNYRLAKAEILNIINLRPSTLVEIDPIIEKPDKRFGQDQLEELVNTVVEVLPEPPSQKDAEQGNNADEPKATNKKNMDENAAETQTTDQENMDEDDDELIDEGQIGQDEEIEQMEDQ
ncbi:RNA polymerase II, Rpb4 [Corchorus capsularis]|uniref:DNA-directed RNA polymerase III subunit RPC9 n=1 Tax=Corchorus capsularis TaxID=210143 RepID=A0A1R3G9E2_COCAP|nr:RNA polymerase II, Rpb4 [Corchorus capsularis]